MNSFLPSSVILETKIMIRVYCFELYRQYLGMMISIRVVFMGQGFRDGLARPHSSAL
jgi:hypothetical protein